MVGKTFRKTLPRFPLRTPTPQTAFKVPVGPYMALIFLSTNLSTQRAFGIPNVESLARSMHGHWVVTTQGLGFRVDGVLFDGQNRLLAILFTGMEVLMTISTGMPDEAVLGVDRGKGRTLTENAVMGNLIPEDAAPGIAKTTLEAAMKCIQYEASLSNICDSTDLAEVYDAYKDDFEAISVFYRSKYTNSSTMRESHVLAAFALAHHVYPDESMQFIQEIAASNYPNPDHNYPPRRVAQFLVSRKGKKKVYSKVEGVSDGSKVIYKILSGFKDYLTDRECASLHATETALLFLFPQRDDILKESKEPQAPLRAALN
jgi:hypothetical protein